MTKTRLTTAGFEDGQETMSQGMWAASRGWTRQEKDSPAEPLG